MATAKKTPTTKKPAKKAVAPKKKTVKRAKHPSDATLKPFLKSAKALQSTVNKITAAHGKAKPNYEAISSLLTTAITHSDDLREHLDRHDDAVNAPTDSE